MPCLPKDLPSTQETSPPLPGLAPRGDFLDSLLSVLRSSRLPAETGLWAIEANRNRRGKITCIKGSSVMSRSLALCVRPLGLRLREGAMGQPASEVARNSPARRVSAGGGTVSRVGGDARIGGHGGDAGVLPCGRDRSLPSRGLQRRPQTRRRSARGPGNDLRVDQGPPASPRHDSPAVSMTGLTSLPVSIPGHTGPATRDGLLHDKRTKTLSATHTPLSEPLSWWTRVDSNRTPGSGSSGWVPRGIRRNSVSFTSQTVPLTTSPESSRTLGDELEHPCQRGRWTLSELHARTVRAWSRSVSGSTCIG